MSDRTHSFFLSLISKQLAKYATKATQQLASSSSSFTMINALVSLLFWTAVMAMVATTKVFVEAVQCTFSAPVDLGDGLTLEQVKNSAAGTFTMRLTYTGGYSWIGIGINSEGSDKMVPATAVIGQAVYAPDGITPAGAGIWKYTLTNDDEDASGVIAMDPSLQDLMGATFVQSGGVTTMTFTQYLADYGVVSDDSSWIYAVGLPDNEWTGKHKIHGSFYLPLTDNCV